MHSNPQPTEGGVCLVCLNFGRCTQSSLGFVSEVGRGGGGGGGGRKG